MKFRILMIALAICVISTPAMAAMYSLDAATADDMRMLSFTDDAQLLYVGYNTGFDLLPPTHTYAPTNIFTVGFAGYIYDTDGSRLADATIGLLDNNIDLSSYDEGFLLPIANDNGDTWQYQAYVTDGTNTAYSSWATLAPDTATTLWVDYDGDAFTTASSVGFIIRWNQDIPANLNKPGDIFATSVVPVPAAVILGLLGLGVAGIKLRKYA